MKVLTYSYLRAALKTRVFAGISFLIVCLTSVSAAQTDGEHRNQFDSIYFETAVNISAKDVNKAIRIADSLYKHSPEKIHQLKALMLSSTLFQQKGDIRKSVRYAVKADEIAVQNKYYDWEARIAGFLSTQYRLMGLLEEGNKYLEKGKEVSKKIEDPQMKLLYLGMIYEESAYYEIEYGNYKKAYRATEVADEYFQEMVLADHNKNYFLATNQELFGRISLELGNLDEAEEHYINALEKLKHITEEDNSLTMIVYSGLGRALLQKKDTVQAIVYLSKAEKMVEQSDHLELKIELYKTLSDYYQLVKNYDAYSRYNTKYVEVLEQSERKKKESITDFVNNIQSDKETLTQGRNNWLILSVCLCALVVLIVIRHRRSRKRDLERFRLVMQKMKDDRDAVEAEQVREPKEKKRIMSEETELKLLNDLKAFERGTKYTDKQISLPMLAGMLSTNTKYLSHVLNTYKNKDFNSYINELRIKYIIERLEKNKEFRNFKLSVLAEECGFSSHSKFSAVFKSITGLSPSTFLEYLKKE